MATNSVPYPMAGDDVPNSTQAYAAVASLLRTLSVSSTRASIAGKLGKSYGGSRDIYEALGYTKNPLYDDYAALHRRGDICKRIIEAPVKASWFGKGKIPQITESDIEETPFEQAWLKMVDERHIWHYLARADAVSRIGRYGVLLLGFDDGKKISEPIERAGKLIYMAAYAENNAQITQWVTSTSNERFGQPEYYQLSTSAQGGEGIGLSQRVHFSRVLHLAEDRLESEVYGSPALESILNRVKDLELIVGGGAEGVWRGAFPGTAFLADADANLSGQNLDDVIDNIEDYLHGFKRYLRLQGITPQQLMPQVADISSQVNTELMLISAATGIPKRILLGSEMGELASSQDERAWWDRIEERRMIYCESMILRPFMDRLIKLGVLPAPAMGYTVVWPSLREQSPKETAEVGGLKATALATYVNAIGADMLVPPEVFLEDILGLSKERIAQIDEILGGIGNLADGGETDAGR